MLALPVRVTIKGHNIMEAIEKVLSKVTLSDVEAAPPVQLTKRVTNAHIDDIHGLQLLDTSVFGDEKSTRFLSGSKDGKVKIWNVDGKMEWEMPCSEKSEGDYSRWITALSSCGKKFQAGTRNGVLHSWIKSARSADSDIAFQEVGSFKIPPLVVGEFCACMHLYNIWIVAAKRDLFSNYFICYETHMSSTTSFLRTGN